MLKFINLYFILKREYFTVMFNKATQFWVSLCVANTRWRRIASEANVSLGIWASTFDEIFRATSCPSDSAGEQHFFVSSLNRFQIVV